MVIDSRYTPTTVNRRRECLNCGARFSTLEIDADLYRSMTRGNITSLRVDVVTYADGRPPRVNHYALL